MSAKTATSQQIAVCIEAAYETDREIERMCHALTRELVKFDALCSYITDAGDNKAHSDATVAAMTAVVGEIMDSRAAH